MQILEQVDLLRIKANTQLNPKTKSSLGQYFTPSPICLYMASLFTNISGDIKLLDPGSGTGSLTAAFVDEAFKRGKVDSLTVTTLDLERVVEPYIIETLNLIEKQARLHDVKLKSEFEFSDFILQFSQIDLFNRGKNYTHIIMNPPYKKISASGNYRKALRQMGIETVNLYSGFVALAIQRLVKGGELVAILPRSFCNGSYYKSFRELILTQTAIKHIHIFDSRSNPFVADEVLQENIIIHLIKGVEQKEVTITSSLKADFSINSETNTITAREQTQRIVSFDKIVKRNDRQKFIHITPHPIDQVIVDRLSIFKSNLAGIGVEVSTGAVVDFRLKNDLRFLLEPEAVPLLYPIHLNGKVEWPKQSKKPNAIKISEKSRKWLWQNQGYYVIVRRFSSKEERRRIVATVYDSCFESELIGFDNKLNVFHYQKRGLEKELAFGLYVYLNSTLLDRYYRLFGGHTQVNATDLRNINYPSIDVLIRIGKKVLYPHLSQTEIDNLIEQEINKMTDENTINPLLNQEKITQAIEIITALGMPRQQQNERSALILLALLNLSPTQTWQEIEQPLRGVTPIMNWCRDVYGKEYAPNTRETFRRQTLHQFVEGGLCLYNPDKPDRAVNSPKACYQIAPDLFNILLKYGTDEWQDALSGWLAQRETLVQKYAKPRKMEMIPLSLDDGIEIKLSPGDHSQLIYQIVMEFAPRFAPGG